MTWIPMTERWSLMTDARSYLVLKPLAIPVIRVTGHLEAIYKWFSLLYEFIEI